MTKYSAYYIHTYVSISDIIMSMSMHHYRPSKSHWKDVYNALKVDSD